MIFVHILVLTMQVLLYSHWAFAHSWASYPIGLGLHPYVFRGSYQECA